VTEITGYSEMSHSNVCKRKDAVRIRLFRSSSLGLQCFDVFALTVPWLYLTAIKLYLPFCFSVANLA
jgi:hypothetical protein